MANVKIAFEEFDFSEITELNLTPSCSQETFNLEKLEELNNFTGLKSIDYDTNFKELFSLF